MKIESHKVNFREKAQSKVGSMDNVSHSPGGGNIKVRSQPDTCTLCLRPSESTELFLISQQTKEESVKTMNTRVLCCCSCGVHGLYPYITALKHSHPPSKEILLPIQLHNLKWDPFTIHCTVLILNKVTKGVLDVSDRVHDLVMVISDWKQRSPAHLLFGPDSLVLQPKADLQYRALLHQQEFLFIGCQ